MLFEGAGDELYLWNDVSKRRYYFITQCRWVKYYDVLFMLSDKDWIENYSVVKESSESAKFDTRNQSQPKPIPIS